MQLGTVQVAAMMSLNGEGYCALVGSANAVRYTAGRLDVSPNAAAWAGSPAVPTKSWLYSLARTNHQANLAPALGRSQTCKQVPAAGGPVLLVDVTAPGPMPGCLGAAGASFVGTGCAVRPCCVSLAAST